jgi:CBS domain-containing protein
MTAKTLSAPRLDATAKDIMKTQMITVAATAPLSEALRLLAENRISGMPVTDQRGRAVGVISYRDLLEHYAEDEDAVPRRGPGYFRIATVEMQEDDVEVGFEVPPEDEDKVGDVMNAEVIHVAPAATVREIARTMVEHGVHRVLVADRESHRVVGLVTSMDVLGAIA